MRAGDWGHAELHKRSAHTVVGRRGRRKCGCGCGKRCTHTGRANGVAMTSGCEFSVRVWVRDGTAAIIRRSRRAAIRALPGGEVGG